jgi:polyhydroxybutyrate depolymerase
VIYPVGIDGHWNDGRGAGRTKTVEMNTDDVAFLSDVAKTTQITDKPLYLLGMSNGGMMAMRLVCQSEIRFAGMATVASNLPAGLEANCPQKNPLPVWLWFGSEDRVLPNAGGAIYDNAKAWGVIASKDETIRFWERYNNVFVPPIHEDITTVDDGTRLIRERYKGRAPLVVHTAQGAGHTWPGEPSFFALITLRGKVSYQIDGTTALLDWFDSL